jgi:GNAT superfamily N-acetyltransferase
LEKDVTTIALEMRSPSDFHPKKIDRKGVRVEKIEIPTPSLNHYFFVNVGRPWKWYSRLSWTLSDWQAWVEKGNVHTFVGYVENTPFGYIELDQQGDSVEIALFGVLPQFIGYGLGGYLLSEAIRLAWKLNPERVWVHTCTLDHKYALNNYQDRGLSIYQKTSGQKAIPDDDDPLWTTPDYFRSIAEEYEELSHQHAKTI